MVAIPNQDIHSLEMIQKYPKLSNGTTIIKYFIEEGAFPLREIFNEIGVFSLPNFLDIEEFCDIEDSFNVQSEGQFFVKASSYKSSLDLAYARHLAIEDDLRYKLFHNQVNVSVCPGLYNVRSHLALNYSSFYQSFVLESKSISELYSLKNPLVENLTEISFSDSLDKIKSLERSYDKDTWLEIRNKIEYSFKVYFEQNSNIMFIPTLNQFQANLVIYPILQQNPESTLPIDLMLFQKEEIQKMFLVFSMPGGNNTALQVNDYTHGLAHIFLDHPCENYYPCSKGSVQAKTPGIEYLTVMSQLATIDISKPDLSSGKQIIQSLLPWDIAALRHSYGMPQPQNMTYILNDIDNFKKVFSVIPYNDNLVTYSSTGYNIIDARSVKEYEIDLRYDHISGVVTQLFPFKFLLSYDTQIAEIIVDAPGVITLNENVQAIINVESKNYELILSGDAFSECIQNDYGMELIQISNYNESIHHICLA